MAYHKSLLAEANTYLGNENYAVASKYFINYIAKEKKQPSPDISSLIEAHSGLIEALEGLTVTSAKDNMAYSTLFGTLTLYFIREKTRLEAVLTQKPSGNP